MESNDKTYVIKSVADFVNYVMKWNREGQIPIAFRGQKFEGWTTLPKIFRKEIDIYEHEKHAIRDLISIHPQEFHNDETMFDRLVRMQHFDLPTRLLDVTINPLVALYFATEDHQINGEMTNGKVQAFFIPQRRQRYYDSDRVSCMANMANLTLEEKKGVARAFLLNQENFNDDESVKRLLWFVRIEKPHFEPNIIADDLKLPVFVKPKMSNRRIIAQSGAFILYGARRTKPSLMQDDLRVKRIVIPAKNKNPIRTHLERLGIHASSLFPEIDKAAALITKRYSS